MFLYDDDRLKSLIVNISAHDIPGSFLISCQRRWDGPLKNLILETYTVLERCKIVFSYTYDYDQINSLIVNISAHNIPGYFPTCRQRLWDGPFKNLILETYTVLERRKIVLFYDYDQVNSLIVNISAHDIPGSFPTCCQRRWDGPFKNLILETYTVLERCKLVYYMMMINL